MSGDGISPSEEQDLKAAMGLIRGAVDSRSLNASVLEHHLGWPEGKFEEWLDDPYKARVADYIRLLRLVVTRNVERQSASAVGEDAEPGAEDRSAEPSPERSDDSTRSFVHAGAHRYRPPEALSAPEALCAPEADAAPPEPNPLLMMELHLNATAVSVEGDRLSASQAIELIRFYEGMFRKLVDGDH